MAGAIRERSEDYYGKSNVVKYINKQRSRIEGCGFFVISFCKLH